MGEFFWSYIWPLIIMVAQSLLLLVVLLVAIAYVLYADRKIWAAVQIRRGPNVVGPWGLFQSFADLIKFALKEVVIPDGANKGVFVIAPLVTATLALAAWAVVPVSEGSFFGLVEGKWVIADINVGILYLFAISSLGVYGIIIAGWASNSKYAFLGAMRSAAQIVSYEIAMGFALVGVLIASQSLNLSEIVAGQRGEYGILNWFWIPLLPLMVTYIIAGVAETNRAPFDVAEGESEIVAGFHVEYSGMTFAVFFLAEYANMWLIAALTSVMFLGGWLSPFPESWSFLGEPGIGWLLAKMVFVVTLFLWFRATFPRYRYDQIMRLGWKVFIPVTLVWIVVLGIWTQTPLWVWWRAAA